MTGHWTTSLINFFTTPWVRGVLLTLYYLAIIIGLILMYGKGNFSSAPFIYQGF